MKAGSKEDYLLLDKHEKRYIEGTADRLIKFMNGLSNTLEGYNCLNISDGFLGNSENLGWKKSGLPCK